MEGKAAQRNLVGFCTFEGRDFKLLAKKQTVLLLVYIPPPIITSTHLCLFSVRLSPRGRGCHRHHGDGLRGASQLLSGTINKHQSLVNISLSAWPAAPGSTGDASWRGGGGQKGAGSRQDGNNRAEATPMMRRDERGGRRAEEASRDRIQKPLFWSEQQGV